jgi:hypothetical protein
LTAADHWGTFKARFGVGRMEYTVDPGLYAVGEPCGESPVLVTANYKMSFDSLRASLANRSAWLLVLDTKGINVWCAAGKGSFGTRELVERIESSGLARITGQRKLILPQLGAPGVAGHEVRHRSGFRVVYGPIRSDDLPGFLDAGLTATPEMRRKTFGTWERIVLIPVELVQALTIGLYALPIFFLLAGLGGPGTFWSNATHYGSFAVAALLVAIVAGAVVAPVLLPWLPGRAFAIKGVVVGLLAAAGLTALRLSAWSPPPTMLEIAAWWLMTPAVAAYLAMNFTGASTYTSLSGVKKEMRYAVPLQIAGFAVGFLMWIGSRFIG